MNMPSVNMAQHNPETPVHHDAGVTSHVVAPEAPMHASRPYTGVATSSQRTRNIVLFVLGCVVGFGIAWLIFHNRAPSAETPTTYTIATSSEDVTMPASDSTTATAQYATSTVSDANTLLVKDQRAGSVVFLSRIELAQAGWVVIREYDAGEPGSIYGAARFDAGAQQGSVELLAPTQAGYTYQAGVYYDDGDRMFDFMKDTLVLNSTGMPFGMTFEAY